MRSALFVPLVVMAATACDGKPLTGPDAQRIVAQAKSAHLNFDSGPLFFLDGVRMGSDSLPMRDLDPATIEAVQIVKGTVATSTYGPKASHGVVLMTTKRFAAQHSSR